MSSLPDNVQKDLDEQQEKSEVMRQCYPPHCSCGWHNYITEWMVLAGIIGTWNLGHYDERSRCFIQFRDTRRTEKETEGE